MSKPNNRPHATAITILLPANTSENMALTFENLAFSIGYNFWLPYSTVVLCHFVHSYYIVSKVMTNTKGEPYI